jgi:5'-nucleotidase
MAPISFSTKLEVNHYDSFAPSIWSDVEKTVLITRGVAVSYITSGNLIGMLMILSFLTFVLFTPQSLSAQKVRPSSPKRVLITNDNGIADPKIVALARAFAPHAETWVVAPAENRSGSTHYLSVSRSGQLVSTSRDLGPGIRAWAVDGYPADCVMLALYGIMQGAPPDLVISGINGGPNLAHDWLGSGTIGAARMAAYAGFPAIAISGLNDDIPSAVEAATKWVTELAKSPAVHQLKFGQYLTVSIPRIPPSNIKGVRFAQRADLLLRISFATVDHRGEPASLEDLNDASRSSILTWSRCRSVCRRLYSCCTNAGG